MRVGVVFLLSALACLSMGQSGFGSGDSIRWSTFRSGSHSQIEGTLTRVINNETEFRSYWAKAMGESPNAAPKGVDWLKEQLVAIHVGQKPTGGYSAKVNSIKRTRAAEITIEYAEVTPRTGSMNSQALTQPWVIVRMDRAAGNIYFRKTTEEARLPVIIGTKPGCGCCSKCNYSLSGGHDYGVPVNTLGNAREIWWRPWDQGEKSLIEGFATTIIRGPSQLGDYWRRHAGRGQASWRNEGVDWTREQLVAIHLGKTMGPGYQMYVESVAQSGPRQVTVSYVVVRPPQGPPIVTNVSTPFAIFRMPRTDDFLIFRRRDVQPYVYTNNSCDCCSRCRGR